MTLLYGYDFEYIIQSLGYDTTITLKTKDEIKGFLYTIDPETENVVIYNDAQQVQVIMSHFIQEIKINRNIRRDTDRIFNYEADNPFTKEWLESRRRKVIKHLKKNHVPVDSNEDDTLISVLGCVQIEPPYAATNVICDNALIRKRVRDLLLLEFMQHD